MCSTATITGWVYRKDLARFAMKPFRAHFRHADVSKTKTSIEEKSIGLDILPNVESRTDKTKECRRLHA
jgi:hypothetical protein